MTNTRILQVDPADPSPAVIREAARVLRDGGTVAFPTETVYGLGALADDAACVEKIFAAKDRPAFNPLIAHVPDLGAARALASAWPPHADALARAFWPGPLTLVVPRNPARIPDNVSAGRDSVAVRAPAHPVALALLHALGRPIAAPSANRSQTLSPTSAAHVLKSLNGRIDMVLDGGPCAFGIESTVVDLTSEVPMILRPGAISLDDLRAVVPGVIYTPSVADSADPRPSPGMLRKHYAPRAKLMLVRREDLASHVARTSAELPVGVILAAPEAAISALPNVITIALGESPEAFARALFAGLHTLDDCGCATILVAAPPETSDWAAVRDRLHRAATD